MKTTIVNKVTLISERAINTDTNEYLKTVFRVIHNNVVIIETPEFEKALHCYINRAIV